MTTLLFEQCTRQSKHDGSVLGREFKNCHSEKHHSDLMEDYSMETPLYPPVNFRGRFRIRRDLFFHILNDVVA